MKELNLRQLEAIRGGLDEDIVGFIDGFCTAVGVASAFTGVGTILAVGCGGWAIYRLFS